MKQACVSLSNVFKALADPKRLRIIGMLAGGEMCVCRILDAFDVTQPTLSHDMKVLSAAGIVTCRREGKRSLYSLNTRELERALEALRAIVSSGESVELCTAGRPASAAAGDGKAPRA